MSSGSSSSRRRKSSSRSRDRAQQSRADLSCNVRHLERQLDRLPRGRTV